MTTVPPPVTPPVPPPVALLVGAAGEIGSELLSRLPALLGDSWAVRGADVRADAARHIAPLDITDLDAYAASCAGVDTVVHLAGERDNEATWEQLYAPNVVGAYHAFEAARRAGCRRVIFASSVHADGPTGVYGATKVWGEALAHVYAERHGVSTICLRIGWAGAPDDTRKLRIAAARAVYLTYGDAARLVAAGVTAPDDVHHAVLNATSANTGSHCSIDETRRIVGYDPQDDAQALWTVIRPPGS